MKEKKQRKNLFITLGTAAVLLLLGGLLLYGFLARSQQAIAGEVHVTSLAQTAQTEELPLPAQDTLTVRVYLQGHPAPTEGVSSQYAVALAQELAQRVFAKPLTGRVFVNYFEEEPTKASYWSIDAEVEGGSLSCAVDLATGEDTQVNYWEGSVDWGWFDNWDEAAMEQQRLEIESQVASMPQAPSIPEEEKAYLNEVKRQDMLDFVQTVADQPHGAKAVELVNQLGLGEKAKALSGAIMMEGSHGADLIYLVEVTLDNGKYLVLSMDRTTMQLYGYDRYDANMAETYYGP